MILDIDRFTAESRPLWDELSRELDRLAASPDARAGLASAVRFDYLDRRATADLARLGTFAHDPGTRTYLESLVARAYAELHEVRTGDPAPEVAGAGTWLLGSFPRAVRRRWRALAIAAAMLLAGVLFGAFALAVDPAARAVVIPSDFSHLAERPSARVDREEAAARADDASKGTFSAQLMRNNIGVSIRAMAFGATFGVGTVLLLFHNGAILGAVGYDYVADGQTRFLAGWLLPHGSFEIPAVVLAGQAGLVLAGALIGWGDGRRLRARLRSVVGDLATIIGGVSVMLVWAGLVEAFFSQYHEPVLPYAAKITFGMVELAAVGAWLGFGGLSGESSTDETAEAETGTGRDEARQAPPTGRVSELRVRTPEGVEFGFTLAGPVSRCLAWCVDIAVMALACVAVACALSVLAVLGVPLLGGAFADLSFALVMLALFVIPTGYAIAAEWRWRGQTPGKRALGLRVIDERGLRLRFNQVVVRNLLRAIDGLMPPGLYLVGGAAAMLSARGQRLGDLAAGTVVVRDVRPWHDPVPSAGPGAVGANHNSLADIPHLAARLRQKVSPREHDILRRAVARRDIMDPAARTRLFSALAGHFRGLVPYPDAAVEGLTDEHYVRDVLGVVRAKPAGRGIAGPPIAAQPPPTGPPPLPTPAATATALDFAPPTPPA